ncbi:GNAT family acetyltransferase [Arachidicoccus ginsenosidimutans]|uniref:GNAT family N-acetyltransferase n=1 Tax=Arachidicoccus sp. BS20 TaxID=1850526 RepID=UPI0007F0FB99|nr:GNAT family N-acetyltransferase [Arachidicoccus sp. BS20]ANI88477.1 GNAT family acetyltransferase [Arachidicoccus sp. BS20]
MSDRNFNPFPVLKTDRLTLRQLVSSDDNEIFALRSNETVNKYLGRKPAKSANDAKAFIQTIHENIQKNDSIYWAITLNGTDKLIGTICLFDFSEDNLKAETGYELLPDFQGKGIMQEAFSKVIDFAIQHVGLKSIEAYTHSENQHSIRLLEKFNFKKNSTEGNFITYKLTCED